MGCGHRSRYSHTHRAYVGSGASRLVRMDRPWQAGVDDTIRLWDVGTGRVIRTLTGHTDWVRSVSFSPDGQTLASGSVDDTIRLWDVGTGRVIRTLTGHTSWVRSVSFSPDGQTLASGSSDDTIRLWDVGTGRVIRTLTGHTSWVRSVSFSPDGQTLASGSLDGTIRLWDVGTGRVIRTLTGHTDWVLSVSFSPDGQTLASGSWDVPSVYGMWAQVALFAHSPGIRIGSGASRLVRMDRPWQAGVMTVRFCCGICRRMSHLNLLPPTSMATGPSVSATFCGLPPHSGKIKVMPDTMRDTIWMRTALLDSVIF